MPTVQKPDMFPVWASDDQADPISKQNNVLVPPTNKQQYGWARLEFPPRNWFNWLARKTYQWLQYLYQMQAQEVTTTDSTGATPIFDVVNGGMVMVYIVDLGAFSTWYEGIVYIPPGYSAGTTTLRTVASGGSALTIGAISATGSITVTGGTGSFIIYGKTKTPGL